MHAEVDSLRGIPLFAARSDEDLERISRWLEVRHVDEGSRLTPEGAAGFTFFVIEDGRVDVKQDGEVIATLGPGEFFGEAAILGGGRRNADVIATSPATVFAMFGVDFLEMKASMPEIATEIQQTYERRQAASAG